MKQGSGRTRGLALCVLAALMVMGLSGTAMAKWWKGSHTEKWHENKWGGDTKPPLETEIAQVGYNFWAWGNDQYYPFVNVEGINNVAAALYFVPNREEKNVEVNIKDGALLTLGSPGEVAKIEMQFENGGLISPNEPYYPSRVITLGTGRLAFNSRSSNAQVNTAHPVVLHLGAVDVPKMADTDGGVYQTGWVTLIGRIKALGGHESWRLRDSRLTVDRAEYLDSPAPDVLKLWFEPHTADGEAVLDITENVKLENAMLAVGAKGKAVLAVAAEKSLTLTKAGQFVNRQLPTHSEVVKRGEGALVLAGNGVLHGEGGYSDLEALKVESGTLQVKAQAFQSVTKPVEVSLVKGTAVAFDKLDAKHSVSLELVPGAAISLDAAGAAASPILQVAALSGDVTLDMKNLPDAATGTSIVAVRADSVRGLSPVVVLVGAKSDQYEASVSGNTIVLTRRGSAPSPTPTPNPNPTNPTNPNNPNNPKPSPNSGKDKSGGGCDAGLGGLALLLAASQLLKKKA